MPSARLLLLGFAAVALGCSKKSTINLGDSQAVGGRLSDYAGSWDGYAEAYTFRRSNSDRVRIVLDAQGNGTVQVGDDPLLPDPTDPDVGFPVGEPLDEVPVWQLSAGVLYPVYAGRVQVNRLQLGLKPFDLWRSWCALQTSYPAFAGWACADAGAGGDAGLVLVDGGAVSDAGLAALYTYNCVPGPGVHRYNQACFTEDDSTPEPGRPELIDCGKLDICLAHICACTKTGCTSMPDEPPDAPPNQYPVQLDLGMDETGTILKGTLVVNMTRVTVHLERH